jgi:beta-lactamase regulating signal transducer with metallopeptidase domain
MPPPSNPEAPRTMPASIPVSSVAVVWAALASLIALRYLLSLAAVAWMKRRGEPLVDQRWRDAADIAAATLGLSKPPALLVSSRINVPFTCGLFRPALVVPSAALEWSEDRIRVVCLHELGHVGRRDCLMQAVTQFVCAIYWFNPLAWIGARQLRAERERACDDLVLEAGTRGAEYAAHLLEIAGAAVNVRPRLATAAIAMARPSELEGRLLAILDPRLDRAGARRRAVWQVCAFAALVALPIATVRLVARDAVSSLDTQAAASSVTAAVVPGASSHVVRSDERPPLAVSREQNRGDHAKTASRASEKVTSRG